MRVFGISALLALMWAQEASGHAMFMTEKGTSCLKKLAPGIEIMGVNAVLDDKTSVIVSRRLRRFSCARTELLGRLALVPPRVRHDRVSRK